MAIVRKQARRGYFALTGTGSATKFPIAPKSATGSGSFRISGTGNAFQTSASTQQPVIIDDGAPGFTTTGVWGSFSGQGYGNDVSQSRPSDPASVATWTFSGLQAGTYRVGATWTAVSNRATNAPYTVNGTQVLVNQQVAPTGYTADGATWMSLGNYTAVNGTITVTLSNSGINGNVIADAVRVNFIDPNAPPLWENVPGTINAVQGTNPTVSQYASGVTALTYSWSSSSAARPTGVDISTNGTITISGSTAVAATSGLIVKALDLNGRSTDSPAFTLNVTAAQAGSGAFTNVTTGTNYTNLDTAILESSDGDTITILPGTYIQQLIVYRSLTIKSAVVGQKAIFDTSTISTSGGYNVITLGGAAGKTVVLEDIEAFGSKFSDSFNAGFTWFSPQTTITLRRCRIHGCSNGVFTQAVVTDGSLTLEDCEIYDNGDGTVYKHQNYIGAIDNLTVRGCYIYNSATTYKNLEQQGHLLKSRARSGLIESNRLTMENPQYANRCIDIPNGGDYTIRGNLLEYYTNQNVTGQAISWGVEGANTIAGTGYEPNRTFNLRIYQNTIVSRNTLGEHPIWVGVGKISTPPEGSPNPTPMPAPTVYDVRDNVFAGWVHNPPRVIEGNGNTNSTTYAISAATNTIGPLSILTSATGYDYTLVTPVQGSQNWVNTAYQHPASRVARSDNYRGGVKFNVALRPWIAGNGSWVDGTTPGSPTYSTVTALRDAIISSSSGAGGMVQVPNTQITPAVSLTQAQLNAISPANVLAVNNGANANALMGAWGSAGFDGKSFLLGAAGGHFAYWGNEMYRVRFTDPPAVVRMHDPFPIRVVRNDALPNQVSDNPAEWATFAQVRDSVPVKGARASHQYNVVKIAPNGCFVCSGANSTTFERDETGVWRAYGMVYIFDPNAANADAAWTEINVNPYVQAALGYSSPYFGIGPTAAVVRDDGTILVEMISTVPYNVAGVIIDCVNKTARAYVNGVDGNPYPRSYFAIISGTWLGKAANGQWYYTYRNDQSSNPTDFRLAVYRQNGTKLYGPIPAWWGNSGSFDDNGGYAIVGNKIVFWNATNNLGMLDVNTGVWTETSYPAYSVTRYPNSAYNGTFGRFAYMPQINAFVGMSSETTNAHLIVPPTSWGIGS